MIFPDKNLTNQLLAGERRDGFTPFPIYECNEPKRKLFVSPISHSELLVIAPPAHPPAIYNHFLKSMIKMAPTKLLN